MKVLPKSNTHFINTIIHNKLVLYVILFASLINMTAYGLMGDITTPLIFVLVGIITAYYNKNMIIILVVALAVSNVLKCGTQIALNTEGFTEGLENTTKSKKEDGTNENGTGKDGTKEDGTGKDGTKEDGTGEDNMNDSTKILMESSGTKNNKDGEFNTNMDEMTEEEKEQMNEFLKMKNKVIEIIDSVENSVEKLNKKINDLQIKLSNKWKEPRDNVTTKNKEAATTKDKEAATTKNKEATKKDKEAATNSFSNPYTSK